MYSHSETVNPMMKLAILAALRAGKKVSEDYYKKLLMSPNTAHSSFLKSPQQLVTETDIASDLIIKNTLYERLNDYIILSEEGLKVIAHGDSNFCWIIDPLDGTTNFAKGISYFVVAITLVEHKSGQPVLAVVYNPITTELYTAEHKKGCYLHILNKHQGILNQHIDEKEFLENETFLNILQDPSCFIALQCQQDIILNHEILIDTGSSLPHAQYAKRLQHLMQLGEITFRDLSSAILTAAKTANFAKVTASITDDVHIWDIAPSILMIEEAGGVLANVNGQDFGLKDYMQQAIKNYLSTLCVSESEREEAFLDAVKKDIGSMIISFSREFLEERIIPCLITPVDKVNHGAEGFGQECSVVQFGMFSPPGKSDDMSHSTIDPTPTLIFGALEEQHTPLENPSEQRPRPEIEITKSSFCIGSQFRNA